MSSLCLTEQTGDASLGPGLEEVVGDAAGSADVTMSAEQDMAQEVVRGAAGSADVTVSAEQGMAEEVVGDAAGSADVTVSAEQGVAQDTNIPEVVIFRLPIYVRTLALLSAEGRDLVSSQELGRRLRVTPTQIRKDLSYFGRLGRQGRGYNVERLLQRLRLILGLDREWPMALVGVGRLGQAILGYSGFAPEGFRVSAAFDTDPAQVGRRIGSLFVQPLSELAETVERLGIRIGIIAVPAASAQAVTDALVEQQVRAILNYAPLALRVPPGVLVRDSDPVAALQSLTYYLKFLPTEKHPPLHSLGLPGSPFRSEP